MGSVCASTLALLNAGVPLKRPGGRHRHGPGVRRGRRRDRTSLTDILGAGDAFGDMDFKVAGTKEFVTALQLDTKLDGIPSPVLAGALSQAKPARLAILEVMAEAIDAPDEMSPYAPRVTAIKIPVDKIGEVIGPKGKMINAITEETGASISIEDDGTVFVGATDGPSAQAAIDRINAIANPQLPKVGERFLGTVVRPPTSAPSSRCCPAATAWCTSRSWVGASGSARSRMSSGRRQASGGDRRYRQPRQISLIPVADEAAAWMPPCRSMPRPPAANLRTGRRPSAPAKGRPSGGRCCRRTAGRHRVRAVGAFGLGGPVGQRGLA